MKRTDLTMIVLANHSPSETALPSVRAATDRMPTVDLSVVKVGTGTDLRSTIRKYKFEDLPVLIDTTSHRKGDWTYHYRSDIFELLDTLHEKGVKGE